MKTIASIAAFVLAWFIGWWIRKAAYNPTHHHDTRPKYNEMPDVDGQRKRQLRRDERQLRRKKK